MGMKKVAVMKMWSETFMGASGVNIAGDATTRSFEEHDLDIDKFDYLLNKMSIIPKNSLNDRFG
ncbi:hypothetical protein U1Q18_041789, partial [Sarracenia purpurea var. burkii]